MQSWNRTHQSEQGLSSSRYTPHFISSQLKEGIMRFVNPKASAETERTSTITSPNPPEFLSPTASRPSSPFPWIQLPLDRRRDRRRRSPNTTQMRTYSRYKKLHSPNAFSDPFKWPFWPASRNLKFKDFKKGFEHEVIQLTENANGSWHGIQSSKSKIRMM